MVHTIVWRVGGPEALDFWEQRLAAEGVETQRPEEGALRFADFEGLRHELVVRPGLDEPLSAEHPEIPVEHALQGFDGVRAYSADPERSRALLEKVLDARPVGDAAWELRGRRRGGTIEFERAPTLLGRQSAGTVHHVAWGTNVVEHKRWHDLLELVGVANSGDHRPPLLPLDLLPRAERRPVRDRRRLPGLHGRRAAGAARLGGDPAAAPGAAAGGDREAADAAPRSPRRLGYQVVGLTGWNSQTSKNASSC